MRLNVEEMNFLAIFDTTSMDTAVQAVANSLPDMDNKELEEIAEHVLLKLGAMSEEEFAALDFDVYREGQDYA